MRTIKFIGLDVHKNSITIAFSDDHRQGKVRLYGTIDNDLGALDKFCRKMVSTASQLHFVYEAGPCGYGICRHLNSKGFDYFSNAYRNKIHRLSPDISADTVAPCPMETLLQSVAPSTWPWDWSSR